VQTLIQSKHVNIIILTAIILALIVILLLVTLPDSAAVSDGTGKQYETKIFGEDIIDIEISANQTDWDYMITNATAEEYIMVDVVINGTEFQSVGIRSKGNSSLMQVAQDSKSDRFSFRLKFDQYIKGQTCFGLDTFIINNMLGDNSYMKEYLSYDILNYIGVDTPLFNFSNIKVNGKTWGFYLAIEAYDDSYLSRVYGDTTGNLYNVKSMDIGNNDINGINGINQVPKAQDAANPRTPSNNTMPIENAAGAKGQAADRVPGNIIGGGIPGRGSSGGDLKYSTDNVNSYSAIFNNAIGKTSEADQQKVIKALKNLSIGTDLENYFEVDKILRYMAAHTVVVNLDSYSSSMAQNYYIYEKNGKITILPWDYNFSFGGFQSGSASAIVNFPIDTPVSGITIAERPLFDKLLANEEYKAKYHAYLNEIMTGYFTDGKWTQKIEKLDALITYYVQADPTSFCTFEEYKKALPAMIALGDLRTKSIIGQLSGAVPSTITGQSENSKALISVDALTLSDLGTGIGGGEWGNIGKVPNQVNNGNIQNKEGRSIGDVPNMPDAATMQKAMEIIQSAGAKNLSEEQMSQLVKLGLTKEQITSIQTLGNQAGGGMPNQKIGAPNEITNTQNNIVGATIQRNQSYIIIVCGLFILLLLANILLSKYKRNY